MRALNAAMTWSVLSVFVLAGCGDDSSSADGGMDAMVDGDAAAPHCDNGVLDGDEEGIDCGGSCTPCMLAVESSDPEADASDVELDRVLRVTFDRSLDTSIAEDALVVRDSGGARINGRTVVDRRTLIFTPTRYATDDMHTLTVSADVASGPYRLGTDWQISFTTSDDTSEGANPPPEEWNPLGPGTQVALGRMPEYALVWTGADDGHVALEDPPYNPAPMMNPGAPDAVGIGSIANLALRRDKAPVVAQLDDDGEEELAIFSADATGNLSLVIADPNEGGVAGIDTGISFALADTFEADAGDFDRDGRDELLLGISRAGERIRYYLVEFDPSDESYGIAYEGEVESEGTSSAEYVRVAAGDIDHDGRAEAILAWHIADRTAQTSDAYYVVHDDADHGLAQAFPFRIVQEGIRWHYHCHHPYIDLATGDLDDDGAEELVFGIYAPEHTASDFWNTTRQCRIGTTLLVGDDFDHESPAPPTLVNLHDDLPNGYFWYSKYWTMGEALTGRHHPVLLTGDLDGAPGEEIMLHNMIFKLRTDVAAGTLELVADWPVRIPDEIVHFGPHAGDNYRPVDLSNLGITQDVGVGDVDGDLKQDIVLLRRNGGEVWVDHFDLDASGGAVVFADLNTGLQRSSTYDGYEGRPLLGLMNVDEDSMIVEQTDHDVYLGDNVIVAVLAAAPCAESLGQDIGGCVTEFGQGTTASWTNGVYVNASAGVTAGFEWEPEISIPFLKIQIAKVELEVAVGIEGSYQHSWATEVSEQITYAAGADNNLVVFKTHVYDRYIYRIVAHPDATKVDSTLTVNVPSGYRTLAVSQDYYNASNGEQMDIDAAILAVTPGDLTSYPREAAARELAEMPGNRLISISSTAIAAPEGASNSIGVELGVTHAESDEFSVGAYLNASLKACGPDASGWNPSVCAGVEGGVSTGYAHSHEWSSDLVFAGSLAGIPSEQFAENGYAAGLFAYETTMLDESTGENQNFIVVSYYVQ